MAKGAHDATAILENLNITLRNTLEALDREEIKAELAQKLHNDQQLPEKGLETLAANTIDLVARLEKLLEPAHLVLADHFLGE